MITKPNARIESVTKASGLQPHVAATAPPRAIPRSRRNAPKPYRIQPSTVGKYAGPMRIAVPIS